MSNLFRFKQFTVNQDQCAMKVGTDGVLLGSWIPISDDIQSILDIGTGTGLIAMMLAQRSRAPIIDAIEIEPNAFEQAVENFENTLWSDRLFCYHASFQEFYEEIDDTYDLIVSNPPFYSENYKSNQAPRDLARFQDALPLEELFSGSSKLLSDNGQLAMIIPFSEQEKAMKIAEKHGLYPQKITHVRGNAATVVKRSMMLFGFNTQDVIKDELIIELSRHQYTKAYIDLTKDFYLD